MSVMTTLRLLILAAAVLGISRANAYTLMHSKDFPTITIGKRMIVPKDKLLAWMDERMSA